MSPYVVDANVWVAAADPSDPLSDASRKFFERLSKLGSRIALPAHAHVEVASALALRLQNAAAGRDLASRMLQSPMVDVHALDAALLEQASVRGTSALLRSGEAIYVALAARVDGVLVSWNEDVVQRASAATPESWMAMNPVN